LHNSVSQDAKEEIRKKYELPLNKKVFVYGGNLGKPQGVDFLMETIAGSSCDEAFFLVIGSGTEYSRIEKWFVANNPANAKLLAGLPKKDYDILLQSCDAGLIFLHRDFTIPNFPSRLLSYLEMKMPVIAATDPNTDIGTVIENNNCGYYVLSGDLAAMNSAVNEICYDTEKYNGMKQNAWDLLQREYTVEHSYKLIKNRMHV
jgi:glycosyltransferase involved in cell wall biosynthesis